MRRLAVFALTALLSIAGGAFSPATSAVGPSLGSGSSTLAATTTGWTSVNSALGAGNELSVSGFTTDVLFIASIPSSNGQLRLTSTTGLTQASGYSNWTTGTTSLGFTGTMADVNAALTTLEYRGSSGASGVVLNVHAAMVAGSGMTFNPENSHYYQYVSTPALWVDALSGAATVSLQGTAGYLATSTSPTENSFISALTGGETAWLGAADNPAYNANASETVWAWVAGPEAGTVFLHLLAFTDSAACPKGLQGYCTIHPNLPAQYNHWEPNKPDNNKGLNNFTQGEDALSIDGAGLWNDRFVDAGGVSSLPSNGCLTSCSDMLGYVREFSAAGGGAVPNTSVARALTVDVSSPAGVPAISKAVPGDASAAVTWTAPVSGGTPASYTVTANPGGRTCTATHPTLTCTVTGLVNGTSYTFTATATNAAGTGSASSASSAIKPRVAPAAPPSVAVSGNTLSWGDPTGTYASSMDRVYVFYRPTASPTAAWKVLAHKAWTSGGGSLTLGATRRTTCATANPGWTCAMPTSLTALTSYQYRVAMRRPAPGLQGGTMSGAVSHTTA